MSTGRFVHLHFKITQNGLQHLFVGFEHFIAETRINQLVIMSPGTQVSSMSLFQSVLKTPRG